MKNIKLTLLLTLLSLSLGISQLNAFEVNNSKRMLTRSDMHKCINQVIDVLAHEYIFPEKSKILATQLKKELSSKKFNKRAELGAFALELAIFMRQVSGDSYLDVTEARPKVFIGKTKDIGESNSINDYGFTKVEILSGNIGYFKLNHLYQAAMAEEKGTKVFSQLAEVDAIIIDLRDVEGDSLSLAIHLMSFFVDPKTVLANVIYEKQELRETLVASQSLGFERFKDNFPLYILTSSFVSGTGEFLSYTLKHLNKAVIVGENTMGVAYISKSKEVNEFININLPIAIPIHPLTHANWEEEGVIPDYSVKAKLSFDVAYNLTRNYLGIL